MKKVTLIFMILLFIVGASSCAILDDILAATSIVEEDGFTMELSTSFEKETEVDDVYYNSVKEMFVQWYHFNKELDMDGDAMLQILVANEFEADDVVSVDQKEIDGIDVYQVQYRILTTGNNNIHYYYSGLLSVFEMDDEFLAVDAYLSMEESIGINNFISDDDLQILHDITNSIVITGSSDAADAKAEIKYSSALMVELSSNWDETYDGENGFYDWGYYASYSFADLPLIIDFDEYSEENVNDMENIKEIYADFESYEFYKDITIADEEGYTFVFDATSSDSGDIFYYGIVAETEHYSVYMYIISLFDDYEMSDDIIEAFYTKLTEIE